MRVIRACRDMGLSSVAVYSECDRGARHVRMADEACAIGPSTPAESYLNVDRLLEAARQTGADAVHPGYGFLAESARFAAACRHAGLTFIGPTPEAIALMGSKTEARRAALAAGVPAVPGTEATFGPDTPEDDIAAAADRIGYPLLIKAVAGGGGKGMRAVDARAELASAVRAARSEAATAFGDSAVYLERRLVRPRHIEVQLLGDRHGTVIPFVERECSIQRRHQKVIEETPSPVVTPALRLQLTAAAAAVARSVKYTGAGTIEFLVDEDRHFWFLEMNTRLQVEHPITEMVTGIDLVEWQIRIAGGDTLDIDPAIAITPRGHAIECRIYAEDPETGFIPSPGRIAALRAAAGPWVRDDGGPESGGTVPLDYDPLISKLSAWGPDRSRAIARMARALREYEVLGVQTTVPFFRWMLDQTAFQDAAFHTGYLDELLQQRQGASFTTTRRDEEEAAVIAAALHLMSRREAPIANFMTVASPAEYAMRLGATDVGSAHREQPSSSRSGWKARARLEALRS